MGLFDRSRQSTETTTTISNITDESTSVIQDAYNQISSTTNSFEATDSFKSMISQPIAILANGSDAGFDTNKFFNTALKPGASGDSGPNFPFLPLLVVGIVVFFGFKLLRKR